VTGGNGGNGGAGANIYLFFGTKYGTGTYDFCGGEGGLGGKGGCGSPAGAAGGCNGAYGAGGHLYHNRVLQNIFCDMPYGEVCGPDGDVCTAACDTP
jgi:hypothetical protein